MQFQSGVVFLLCSVAAASVQAFNVSVEEGGGLGASSNGAFVGGVWTPTADSVLTRADLDTALDSGDVQIITNGAGDISFENGLSPFTYDGATNRRLTLNAQGAVSNGGISSTAARLEVVLQANNGAASNLGFGLVTNGGAVSVTAQGDIDISGFGVITQGGGVTLSSLNGALTVQDNGIQTSGEGIAILAAGDIRIRGNGLQSDGGDISVTSSGGSLDSASGGIDSSGGNITVNVNGAADFDGGGIQADGGSVAINAGGDILVTGGGVYQPSRVSIVSSAGSLTIRSGGIGESIGPVDIQVAGDISASIGGIQTEAGFPSAITIQARDLSVTDGGITTQGGDFSADLRGNFSAAQTGIRSVGGAITVNAQGAIQLMLGDVIFSGSDTIDGGAILLRAGTGFTVDADANISSAQGTGGLLTVDPEVSLNQAPTVGAGDISLLVGFDVVNVPSIAPLGLLLMAGLLAVAGGIRAGRRQP